MQNDSKINYWLGCLSLALLVLLLFGVYSWVMDSAFDSVFRGGHGPVDSIADWPRPLKGLEAAAVESGVSLSNVDVYCLADGFCVEYLWRMDSSPDLITLVSEEFGLSPYTPTNDHRFCRQNGMPEWWDPGEHSTNEYFSANLGGIGSRFVVCLDKSKQVIFVHYVFD